MIEKNKYSFIHIPKNAGTSLKKKLEEIDYINYYPHGVKFKNIIGKEIIILREPLDRFTSAFFYLKKIKKDSKDNIFNTPEDLIKSLISFKPESLSFIRDEKNVDNKKIFTNWVFHCQSDWINNPYRILLFEDLERDLKLLSSELNISLILPKLNTSNKIDFKYSEQSLSYLKSLYKTDFLLYEMVKNLDYGDRSRKVKEYYDI